MYFKVLVVVVPVEKWKTDFIVEIAKVSRPQVLWKTCGKLGCLWKTLRH